jgi:hypothetical protein
MNRAKLLTRLWKPLAAAALALGLAAVPALAEAKAPANWILAGSAPASYASGVDTRATHSGRGSGYLKSIAPAIKGFGTLMQISKADDYLGKRVRMSGWVKTANVREGAGLWLRIDGEKGQVLGFDNMMSRPIKDTTDWARYDIVLDVPAQAKALAYGVLVSGEGQVWLDDLKFEVVGQEVPTSGSFRDRALPAHPLNLGFEN